ncbi:MAG: oxidoreductase [Rubrobacteraceae bacterium]
MDFGFEGKVAVVTGASKGIGLAVVRAFAEEGAKVVAGSRRPGEALEELAGKHPVVPVPVDLNTAEGPGKLVARAVEEFGGVDVLVNNVGGAEPRLEGFLSITDEDWLGTLEFNLMSAVRASRAALPHLLENGGAVVNVSSINGRLPRPPVADYAASKAAMTNLSKALSEEFSPQGVRVNAVSPGPVRTPLWTGEGSFGDQLAGAMGVELEDFLDAIPEHDGLTIGRMISPEEVAAAVLFLASERSGGVTGSDYAVDGGLAKMI